MNKEYSKRLYTSFSLTFRSLFLKGASSNPMQNYKKSSMSEPYYCMYEFKFMKT